MLTADLFSPDEFPFPDLISQAQYPWDIFPLLRSFLDTHTFSGIHGVVEPGVTLKNEDKIEIAEGAYVESGAYIVGPCIIGAQSIVRHCAYIRGTVVTGKHCVIGHCTEVKNVYFGHNVQASHFSYVGDSVLGSHVLLGAGVRCANLRLDGANVRVRTYKQKIDTGLRKVGAFIGQRTSIGCNSVTNPGCCLRAHTHIRPGSVVD